MLCFAHMFRGQKYIGGFYLQMDGNQYNKLVLILSTDVKTGYELYQCIFLERDSWADHVLPLFPLF